MLTIPTEDIKSHIDLLHSITAKSKDYNWNKFKFILHPDLSFSKEFIFDKEWQKEVDELNIKEKIKIRITNAGVFY